MSDRVAIIGASGLLGSRLDLLHGDELRLSTCHSRRAGSLAPLNLVDKPALVRLIRDFRPDLVYLPAAVTSPAWCQSIQSRPGPSTANRQGWRLIFPWKWDSG